MSFEHTIFSHLVSNETYARRVMPYLVPEYFQEQSDKVLFTLIGSYMMKYNQLPSKEALLIDLSNTDGLSGDVYKAAEESITTLESSDVTSEQWLLDTTEKFCQDKAIYNAIRDSIEIMDDKSGKFTRSAIPELLSQALGVSFDNNIGHDFLEDAEARYEFYHNTVNRLSFDIDMLNVITKGGTPSKTLNMILAATGVGKSLVMCHMAAHNLLQGRNVLYITMEMAEERIAERIDANLMNVTLDDLVTLDKATFMKKAGRIKNKSNGKLIIKEYPTSSAGVANFRHLLNELKLKKGFVPDVIYVDYINICISSRLKMGANVNSYTLIKAIAEELRGLAVEFGVPIWSATQTNRAGYDNSDISLSETSESSALNSTVDFMLAIMQTEQLALLNQYLAKQLKNRYGDINKNKKFVIGVDKDYMKLYNVEDSAQDDIDEGPVFDNATFGSEEAERNKKGKYGGKFSAFM